MPSEIAVNSTTYGITAVQSTGSWFALLILITFAVVLIMLAILAISSLERYKKLWKFLRWLRTTLGFFGWGILSLIVISIPAGLFYWEYHQASQGNVLPIKWTIAPIIIYAVISFVGYLVKRFIVDRIRNYNRKLRKQNVA